MPLMSSTPLLSQCYSVPWACSLPEVAVLSLGTQVHLSPGVLIGVMQENWVSTHTTLQGFALWSMIDGSHVDIKTLRLDPERKRKLEKSGGGFATG